MRDRKVLASLPSPQAAQPTPGGCTIAPGRERAKKPFSDLTIPHSKYRVSPRHTQEFVFSQTQLPVSKKGKKKIVERVLGHWRFRVSINANESDTCGINFSGSKKDAVSASFWTRKWEKGSGGGRCTRHRKEREMPCGCGIKDRVPAMTGTNAGPPRPHPGLADYSDLLHV